MIQLDLTTQEAQHLKEKMKTRLAELDHEIAHTDSTEFKDMLEPRRESICRLGTSGQPHTAWAMPWPDASVRCFEAVRDHVW